MINLARKILIVFVIGFVVSLFAAQIASYFLLKPILQREVRKIFDVPISIEKAGANLFYGSLWMTGVRVKNYPGFKDRDILYIRTVSFDVSVLSLLTHEFAIQRIQFKDPLFQLEINEKGESNGAAFFNHVIERLERWMNGRHKFVHLIEKYVLEKFAVKNGSVNFIDRRHADRKVALRFISFSLARSVYPPDPEEALPAAVYLNATIDGEKDGKILVLGRLNPFTAKKSFDITGSLKNLSFKEYRNFMADTPLPITEGTIQIKVKALCHENQADIYHQVTLEHMRFSSELPKPDTPLIFGIEPRAIANFFNNRKVPTEAFEFDFRVMGDLSDPKFDWLKQTSEKMETAINERVNAEMNEIQRKTGGRKTV